MAYVSEKRKKILGLNNESSNNEPAVTNNKSGYVSERRKKILETDKRIKEYYTNKPKVTATSERPLNTSVPITPTLTSNNENLAMLNKVDFTPQKPVAQNKTWFESAIDKISGVANNVPIVKIIADAVNETGAARNLTPEQRADNAATYRKNIPEAALVATPDYLKDSLNRLSQSAVAGLASGANSLEEFAHTTNDFRQKYNPVDVVWNKLFPGDAQAKANAEEKTHKYFSDTLGGTQKYYKEKANAGADKLQQFTNQGVEYVAAMLPQLILSIATGGGSAEANLASGIANATKSIVPGLSKGSLSSFGQRLLEMTPFMTQAAGGYMLDAENKNPNLSLEQKMSYGIAGGLSEGITEMLPIGTLKVALGIGEKAAKSAVKKGVINAVSKFGKKGLEWVNNAGANIIQEVAVNPLTNIAEKVFVDSSKPMFGKGGVFDVQQASESTVGALAMSAVLAALGLPANMASHIMASKFVENNTVPTQKDIESILNAIKEDTKDGGIEQQTQEETIATERAPSPFANNAMDRLNTKGQEAVSAARKMPDLNLSRTDAMRYDVYREFVEENLPGASKENVDEILKELRQTEIDVPPAKGDMSKRLNYFIEKHKRDNPESVQQKPKVEKQADVADTNVGDIQTGNAPETPVQSNDSQVTVKPTLQETQPQKGVQNQLEGSQAQLFNVYTSNLKKIAEESGLDMKDFYNETKNINAFNPSPEDIDTIISGYKKLFNDTLDTKVDEYISALDEIKTKAKNGVQSTDGQVPGKQEKTADKINYGKNGKAAFEKWSKNEYINADTSKVDDPYTQKWIKLFDKYYERGRNNQGMPKYNEQGEPEADFPPFILDTIYEAGKADFDLQQKKAKPTEPTETKTPASDNAAEAERLKKIIDKAEAGGANDELLGEMRDKLKELEGEKNPASENKEPAQTNSTKEYKVGDVLTVNNFFGKLQQKVEIVADKRSIWEIKLENGNVAPIGKKAFESKVNDSNAAKAEQTEPVGKDSPEALTVEARLQKQLGKTNLSKHDKERISNAFRLLLNGARSNGIEFNFMLSIVNSIDGEITDEMLKSHNIKHGDKAYIAGKTEIKKSGKVMDATITLLSDPNRPITQEIIHEFAEIWTAVWEISNPAKYKQAIDFLVSKGADKIEAKEMLPEIFTDYVINGEIGFLETPNENKVYNTFFGSFVEKFKTWVQQIVKRITYFKTKVWGQLSDEIKQQARSFAKGQWEYVFEGTESIDINDFTAYAIRTNNPPKKTIVGYKAFRVKKSQPGKLFPLFVNADQETPVGIWLDADFGDNTKTKLGKLAPRPGWHLGDLPRAKHIGKKNADGVIDRQHPDVVWAECEVAADVDWQKEANKRGINKHGKLILKNADIKDEIPEDGYYRYKTNPNMEGQWIIAGAIKINRILTDKEVDEIQKEHGVEPIPREGGPIRLNEYGFKNISPAFSVLSSDKDPIMERYERLFGDKAPVNNKAREFVDSLIERFEKAGNDLAKLEALYEEAIDAIDTFKDDAVALKEIENVRKAIAKNIKEFGDSTKEENEPSKNTETKSENSSKIEVGGEKDGENTVSVDKDRFNIPETPENISSTNVRVPSEKGTTGDARLPETGGTKGTDDGTSGGRSPELGSGLGDNSTRDNDSSGTGAGEQYTGDNAGNVRVNSTSNPKGNDYVINSQQDSIIDNGKKTRYKSNTEAIRLMKQIESEGRPATADEQKVLAKYVGWGGIPEVFTEESFWDSTNRKQGKRPKQGWESEYNELKDLLTEEEYRQANDTILNAHYTSIDVIKGMYEGLRHFGFNGGRVLEPAVGIGNFIGSMPQDMRSGVKVMTGIEIDSVTGRIAKLLYPNADIRVQGFEKAKLATGYYDVAISNVPFGKIAINDRKYPDSITRSIHNYFFAKALDVVRPGGLIMFITSSKTMDSKDTSGIRAYIKNKADVIGAIRLPNTAFKENAMTEVTTDIIILKVREPGTEYSGEAFWDMDQTEATVGGGKTSVSINEYFVNNPDNILGELQYGSNMYAGADVFVKGDGRDIKQGIVEAMKKMTGNIITQVQRSQEETKGPKTIRDSSKGTKEGSYEVVGGKLAVNKDGKLVEVDKQIGNKEIQIISKLLKIKSVARELLEAQRNGSSESIVAGLRKQLNSLYDNFVKEHGYLNKAENAKLLADDPDVSFLLSLENYTKPKKANKTTGAAAIAEAVSKSEIFSKNTVSPKKKIDRADSAKEALIISLNEAGYVDIQRLSELTSKTEQEVVSELAGYIYKNPVSGKYETADEYLSGNVKAKLNEVEAIAINEPEYAANVEALKSVQPADKEAWQISIKLGSSLISEDIYEEFTKRLFGDYSDIEVKQIRQTGEWTVKESEGKGRRYNSVKSSTKNTVTWGINRPGFRGIDLLEKIMNNKSIIVNDMYGDGSRKYKVNNPEATALAQERAEKIKQEFIDWINSHNNGKTIAKIVQNYNDVYNTDVLREFDGSHLPDTLEGMNPLIKLASHQKDAIWRIVSSGSSTLLAHEVGAGKTFEMIAAAMEMKRLGIIKKPLFCVPNNVYEQWGIEFRRLYPGAKILIPSKEELEQKNRRVFMNKIATGSYDAVIIPESQFTMLPMSAETVADFYNEKIREMEQAIEIEIAENGKGTNTEKKITQFLKNLRTKMDKKLDKILRDANNIDFEELGIDALFVDEAHRFKNLMYTTRLQVSGLGNPEGSDKAFDLLMKTRYLQKLNGGRGVVFATATPLLNSIAEVYNWQQYLNPEQLHSRNIYSFDAWASIFAKIENIAEVKPEGTGYRVKSGISKITNVGQLAKMFREFTDFKTQEMLKLPRPDVKDGKYQVISIPGTKWLEEYMEDLAERAEAVRTGQVDPSEDNMLKITTDGRKAALYPGLVDPSFSKEEGESTKIDVAVNHLYEQWNKTKKDRLTHLVFLEFSTPKAEKTAPVKGKQEESGEDSTGDVDNELDSVYQEFKRRLVQKGIPAKEIAFIHDAKNSDQKIDLKNRFNAGEVRILVGNNEKMGVGIDLQKRTKTITHIDFPWRPKDLQQEDGRGLRQGNMNKEIELYVLVTEGSFDARLWDNLQRKSKLVDDMLTSDLDAVEIEDVGVQTLSAQEVVGIASGNPLMQEQIVVSQKVQKLRALEKGYRRDKIDNQKTLARVESILLNQEEYLKQANSLAKDIKATTGDEFEIVIDGKKFTERKEATLYLDELENSYREQIKQEGSYEFKVDFAGVINRGKFVFSRFFASGDAGEINWYFYADKYNYSKDGTLQGLETSLRNMRNHAKSLEESIEKQKSEIDQLKREIDKTFPHSEELKKLTLREQELMRILNPEQVLNVAVETEDEPESSVKSYSAETQAFTGRDTASMPRGDGSSVSSKTVDDLIAIIEKRTGVPIRTGKFRQRALGIFKVQPEVIRTKIRGDMPVISHEYGHYLDKQFEFSDDGTFDNELIALGRPTSKASYGKKEIRQEGIAEFVRLYLTNPAQANLKAPVFLAHFEKTVDRGTLKFLSELRRNISAIINLPNNKKIWNDVSDREGRKSNDKSVNVIQKVYDAMVNEQESFARIQDRAEKSGWTGRNISTAAQIYKGFEAKAINMLFDKQRDLDGKVIGDSMKDILRPISKKEVKKRKGDAIQERKDFISYMISRRAVDYKDRGLVMPEPWYVYEDNVFDMEQKYPHFVDVFDGLRQWEDNNLQLLVDSGIKTQDDIDNIKFMNANHVPLYRIREAAEAIRAGGGNTLGQSKNVIKRAFGSGATIIDPLESMIVDSFIIRRAAESNTILKELYDMAGEIEGIGDMVERVPPGKTKTSFTVQEIRRQMLKAAEAEIKSIKNKAVYPDQQKDLDQAEAYKKSIEDMSEEQLESVMSIYRPLFRERDNEVTVYVNGEKKLLQVESELHKAIKGLNREQMNFLIRALNVAKKVKQAGIVTSVPFVLRNVIRDTSTSLIQSEAGINPKDILMGYVSVAKQDKWFKEWVASGGATEYININDRYQAQKLEDDLLQYGVNEKATMFMEALKEMQENNNERTREKLLLSARNMLEIPFDLIHDAVGISEAGSRVAEFRKAIEKGIDKETAAAWSRKLSVDFLRHGYYGKQVNFVVAFFNANLQGIVRMAETFKSHPIRTMARGLIYVTLPTMLLYFFNHDDEDYLNLPEWRKAMFWNVPIGNGKFLSIPKPPGYGWIFGALPEFTMDKLLKDDPKAWKEIVSTFAQSFSLPTEISAISPVFDVLMNKSWSGVPIENTADRQKPSYLRRDDKTSVLANLFGDIIKFKNGLSPKQLDYLVKQYTGSLGDFFWRLPDTIKSGVENPSDVTRYPVIKSFITDAAYSSASIDNLYNYGEELSMRKKELQETGDYPAMGNLPLDKKKELFNMLEGARSEYNKIADSFSDARKAIKEIRASKDTPGVKEQKIRQIRIAMNKMAAGFNNNYEKFKQRNNIK